MATGAWGSSPAQPPAARTRTVRMRARWRMPSDCNRAARLGRGSFSARRYLPVHRSQERRRDSSRAATTEITRKRERVIMSSLSTTHTPKGLEGVVATTSSICYIDGDQGVLAYRGIDIHELADNSTFEETCYLLWYGELPTREKLKDLEQRLAEERKLDASILYRLQLAPKHALPMDVL